MSRTTTLRSSLTALTLLAGVLVALVLPAGSASAAAYRFWGYYQLSGTSWQFAPKGPDQTKPADGSVEGWRYAVAGESDTRAPRVSTTFDAVCADTKADPAKKRIAVVIDYGRPADQEDGSTPPAPVAKCASVPSAASGSEVLAAVATVRADKGLVCALDGRPATGCGTPVKDVSAAAAAPDTPTTLAPKASQASGQSKETAGDGSSSGLKYAGIGVVVLALLGLGGVALRRRQGVVDAPDSAR
jgi:MYXO-CTERM domain-containing protein